MSARRKITADDIEAAFEAVQTFWEKEKAPPSLTAIGKAINRGKGSTQNIINALVDQGRLEKRGEWGIYLPENGAAFKADLTQTQRDYLTAIQRLFFRGGHYWPTIGALVSDLHKDSGTVRKMLLRLSDLGFVRLDGEAITLLRLPSGHLFKAPAPETRSGPVGAADAPRQPLAQLLEAALDMIETPDLLHVPVLGIAAAGKPIAAVEDHPEQMEIPTTWVRHRRVYLIRVVGDSMIGDLIGSGDYALVAADELPEVAPIDSIWVAWVPGMGATIKRIRSEQDRVELVASNNAYQPIQAPEGTIVQGRVIRIIRDLE